MQHGTARRRTRLHSISARGRLRGVIPREVVKRLAAYIRAIAILAVPLMMASAPPPASVQQSVVVPDGWVADVYLAESGICLRRVGGELLVGGFNTVWSGTTPIAQGGFVAAAIDRAPDGTLYVSEAIFPASLWRFPPDGSGQQTALWGFKYSHGVCVLPNGDVLALDTGWLNFAGEDGKIVKVPPTLASVEQLPAEVTSPLLINPASIELGPDGYVYFAERRYLWFQDGSIWRFKPGNPVAELVLAGLGDPFDTAWAPDGALFITDGTNLLRWHPQTGTIELWASGFVAPHGVDVAPNGDVYV
ncbi:MAG: hypothetical protein HYY17_00675, partial [Planctomycetes bacterium]|nr:hypothetical protein [Planctomycetota bacterium]